MIDEEEFRSEVMSSLSDISKSVAVMSNEMEHIKTGLETQKKKITDIEDKINGHKETFENRINTLERWQSRIEGINIFLVAIGGGIGTMMTSLAVLAIWAAASSGGA